LADPLVRIMPDKRNDQIVSSPKEENTSSTIFINTTGGVRTINQLNHKQLF